MRVISCNDEQLRVLLSEDEGSDEFRAAVRHIDTCETCQARLTTLAADAHWWSDARECLSGVWPDRWEPDLSQTSDLPRGDSAPQQTTDAAVRDLLSPPSHPEMFGRLGRYDIERVIGSGGMGVVLKAHDSELNRPIAIKVLARHLAHVGAARERFAREGRAAAAVVHEHVVAIHDVETEGRVPFLVMQYVPGRSLQARVDDVGPLAVEEILRIGMQASSGLAAAHAQGLVHRDVKPSNILLEETVERAVLTDFGLARMMDDASLTRTGVLAGTPHYMSPEQATGEAVDHRSDLFSLGAVLYFMATGHPPFRAEAPLAVLNRICRDKHRPVWHVNRDIPDKLSDLIDRLLAKRPGRRPASATEVERQLARLLSRVQQYGGRRRSFSVLRSRRGRRRLIRVAAATLLVALVAAAVWRVTTSPPPVAGDPPPPTPAELATAVQYVVNQDREFVSELEAIQDALQQSEQPTYFASAGDDAWHEELESLKHELSQLESEQSTSP